MNFTLEKSLQVLERTPAVLNDLLQNMDTGWTAANEGLDSWSAYDIIGHYIHGEKTDWIPRMEIILSESPSKNFVPFDRFAQFRDSNGKSLAALLEEFKSLRADNIALLRSKNLSENDLAKKGVHPAFGEVTLTQLLAAWVVHDLNHIGQVARVMAKHYKEDVGPWTEYLRILHW